MSVTTNGNRRAAAADAYRLSVVEGAPLSAARLGGQFDRSRSWGRAVISEVRAASNGDGGSQPAAVEPEVAAAGVQNRTLEPEQVSQITTPEREVAATGQPPAAERPYRGEEVPAWVGWLTVASVLLVATAAAVASVDHLAALARLAGTTGWRAWLLPAAVDGLATAAALTLYRAHKTGQDAGALAWVALLAGLAASVAGNIASVYPELVDVGTLKIAVGATPPLSLALSVELALRQVRASR